MSSSNNGASGEPNGEDAQQHPFFFYGTLRRDQENYMLLRGRTVYEQPAYVKDAELYSLKTYPVMIRAEGVVKGELMNLHPRFYQDMVIEFDQLEGYDTHRPETCLFRRELITAYIEETGTPVQAWVYMGNTELLMSHRYRVIIPEGDWTEYRNKLIRATRFGRFILEKK